ncbi:MAG: aminoglycoside phosphotransferase family protein [Balneolales bacterium]|nr:aminoglycoside phosphotransferase family protein [Balneolales bacterium]
MELIFRILNKCIHSLDNKSENKLIKYFYAKLVMILTGGVRNNYYLKEENIGFISKARGAGRDCLNIYRIVITSEKKLFEKIYLNNSSSLKKCLKFYDDYYKLYNTFGIKIPQLLGVIKSKYATALYFEYVNEEMSSVNYFHTGYKFVMNNNIRKYDEPKFTDDYLNELYLLKPYKQLPKLKQKYGLNNLAQYANKVLKSSRLCYNHGDFNKRNVIGEYVIDWDNFDLYPEGHDLSFFLVISYKMDVISASEVFGYVDEYTAENQNAAAKECIYVLLLLNCESYIRNKEDELLMKLIGIVEKYVGGSTHKT